MNKIVRAFSTIIAVFIPFATKVSSLAYPGGTAVPCMLFSTLASAITGYVLSI